MRTLVLSDLHLGGRLQRDVLRRPEALEALLRALDEVDRLVLLGDVIELLEGRPRDAMQVAEPVLRAIGARLGSGREVIFVPGNHDAALVRPWLRARARSLAVDESIPLDATPALARVVSWLEPAHARVHYPGVWLSKGVWATHGHYLDRHLLPEATYGIARGLLGRLPRDDATPGDYEQPDRPSLTRLEGLLTRSLPRPLAALLDDVVEFLRAATMPGRPRRLLGSRIAPLAAMLLGAQMRRASMPALARVVHRLRVDADWVLFGHVHRRGPLPGDDPQWWRGPGGRPQIANTGSWVHEPVLVNRARQPHPYWPGGAILLEDDREPETVGLLDHLDTAALGERGTRGGGGEAMRRATILYDAECSFCVWCASKLLSLDRGRRLRPVALQDPESDTVLEGIDHEARMASWHLVDGDGHMFSAGAAFAPLMMVLSGAGPIARLLERAPRLAHRAYLAVAERRSNLGRLLSAGARRRAYARLEQRHSGH